MKLSERHYQGADTEAYSNFTLSLWMSSPVWKQVYVKVLDPINLVSAVICCTSETFFPLAVETAFCGFLTSVLSVPKMWFLTLTDHLCGYSFISLFLRDLSKLELLFLAICFLNSPLWTHISFVVTQLLTGSWRLKQSRLEMVIWTSIKPRSFLWPNLDFSLRMFVL